MDRPRREVTVLREELVRARARQGISYEALAEMCGDGYSGTSVWRALTGATKRPKAEVLVAIARVLGVAPFDEAASQGDREMAQQVKEGAAIYRVASHEARDVAQLVRLAKEVGLKKVLAVLKAVKKG